MTTLYVCDHLSVYVGYTYLTVPTEIVYAYVINDHNYCGIFQSNHQSIDT